MTDDGWVAFDFDGTLATYDGWSKAYILGEPIMPMVRLAREHLTRGHTVIIFTARIVPPDPFDAELQHDACRAILAIQDWCIKHLGKRLLVTATKDYRIRLFYDDRAVQVRHNLGDIIGNPGLIGPAPTAPQTTV